VIAVAVIELDGQALANVANWRQLLVASGVIFLLYRT
jgi:hypothetical protein